MMFAPTPVRILIVEDDECFTEKHWITPDRKHALIK